MPQWDSEQFKSFSFPVALDDLEVQTPKKNLRLGHFTEYCLEALIRQSERYELLAKNVQVIVDQRTMGELDFILFDQKDQWVKHIELVTKFYLFDPNAKDIGYWIGPNRRDHWALKIAKLRDHQFPLLFNEATLQLLTRLGIDCSNVQQELCFKIMCFAPEGREVSENQDLIQGDYQSFEDFIELSDKSNMFYLPNKRDWLRNPNTQQTWNTYDEVVPDIKKEIDQKRSPMLWIRKPDGKCSRSFITFW